MTILERLEKMQAMAEIAIEAAHFYNLNVWIEGDEEDAQLLIGTCPSAAVGINLGEWKTEFGIGGLRNRPVAEWYVWRIGYTHATREQPEDYHDEEITKTTLDADAVVAAVLDLVRTAVDGALNVEGMAADHGVAPPTGEERLRSRVQYVGQHLKDISEHLLQLGRKPCTTTQPS